MTKFENWPNIEEIVILQAMKTDFLETKNRAKETIEYQKKVVAYC